MGKETHRAYKRRVARDKQKARVRQARSLDRHDRYWDLGNGVIRFGYWSWHWVKEAGGWRIPVVDDPMRYGTQRVQPIEPTSDAGPFLVRHVVEAMAILEANNKTEE